MLELRDYQSDAKAALYDYLRRKDGNPCVVIPTAGGKSICIASVAADAVNVWRGRVLILAHVKELVDQNSKELKGLCPDLPVGVYSAGLDRRDTKEPVIVAGIQSIYNKIDLFEPFDLVMVDEVHMVPPDGEGRYQTFLNAAKAKNPNVRMVGWTATPFRTQGGLICRPENLFNEVCYEANVKDLIDAGWLSKITAKAGIANADLDHLHIRAGEFVAEDVEKAMGEDRLVATACREIVEKTKDRKACLIFCTSVEHCRKVAKLVASYSGEECAIVTGDTPDDKRDEIIRRLKGEEIPVDLFGGTLPPLKYCCNVSVMTTGTNIRRLDTIALLRPTASAGLYIQMVGRGFRLSPETGKTECLVLDYGKNVERFGPIDAVNVRPALRHAVQGLRLPVPAPGVGEKDARGTCRQRGDSLRRGHARDARRDGRALPGVDQARRPGGRSAHGPSHLQMRSRAGVALRRIRLQLLGVGLPGTHGLRPLEVREVVGREGVGRVSRPRQGRGRVRGGLHGLAADGEAHHGEARRRQAVSGDRRLRARRLP